MEQQRATRLSHADSRSLRYRPFGSLALISAGSLLNPNGFSGKITSWKRTPARSSGAAEHGA